MTRACHVEIVLLLLCWTPAAVAAGRELSPHIVLFHETVPARPELAARVAGRAGLAPADGIVSAFRAEPNGVCSPSGTWMAAPHVAGATRSPLWRGIPDHLLFRPF